MNQSVSVILVPSYRYIEPETDFALRKLESRGWQVERRFGCSAIDVARATLATWAVQRGYQDIYWIDGDTDFTVRDFQELTEMGTFACAPYQQKAPMGPINVLPEGIFPEQRGTIEIEAAGFGFMKTHRSIYEAMTPGLTVCQQVPHGAPLIPYFQPRVWQRPDGRHVYYGEDYSFCLHARELGFKLMCNFEIQLGHIGRYSYRIREANI